MAIEFVKCPWCDRQVEATAGIMAQHKDFFPVRVCEGSGRKASCAVDGCDGAPWGRRGHDFCYRHKWMEKAG